MRRLAEQDASKIVARAYEEAARIINEAKKRAEYAIGEISQQDAVAYRKLGDLLKSHDIAKVSYEQIDDLFVQIRHHLSAVTENDKTTADELKNLVNQLEYWFESLVVDSLKLRSIKRWLQGTSELAKILRAKLDRQ